MRMAPRQPAPNKERTPTRSGAAELWARRGWLEKMGEQGGRRWLTEVLIHHVTQWDPQCSDCSSQLELWPRHLIDTLLDYDNLLTVPWRSKTFITLSYTSRHNNFLLKHQPQCLFRISIIVKVTFLRFYFERYIYLSKSRQYFGKLKYFFWTRSVKSTTDKLSNYSWQGSYTVTPCHTITILIK